MGHSQAVQRKEGSAWRREVKSGRQRREEEVRAECRVWKRGRANGEVQGSKTCRSSRRLVGSTTGAARLTWQPTYDERAERSAASPRPCRWRSPSLDNPPLLLSESSGTASSPPSMPLWAAASSLLLLLPRRGRVCKLAPPVGVSGSTAQAGSGGCTGGTAGAARQEEKWWGAVGLQTRNSG